MIKRKRSSSSEETRCIAKERKRDYVGNSRGFHILCSHEEKITYGDGLLYKILNQLVKVCPYNLRDYIIGEWHARLDICNNFKVEHLYDLKIFLKYFQIHSDLLTTREGDLSLRLMPLRLINPVKYMQITSKFISKLLEANCPIDSEQNRDIALHLLYEGAHTRYQDVLSLFKVVPPCPMWSIKMHHVTDKRVQETIFTVLLCIKRKPIISKDVLLNVLFKCLPVYEGWYDLCQKKL